MAWRNFEAVFHLLMDIGFLAVSLVGLRVVLVRRQSQHLRWVVPMVISAAASLSYRTYIDIHLWSGQRWGRDYYISGLGWGIAFDVALCISVTGYLALLGLLRREIPLSVGQFASGSDDHLDIWPPPPATGTEP